MASVHCPSCGRVMRTQYMNERGDAVAKNAPGARARLTCDGPHDADAAPPAPGTARGDSRYG